MDNTIDQLQIMISKARSELSDESREAIDSVNWRQIIAGINTKFNSEQLFDLETETELLLCGLITTEKYTESIENELKISKDEVMLLINELDRLVFKKIQKELENLLNGVTPQTNRPLVFDPRFINISKGTQEAIAMSDWQNNIHDIAKKYKLSIDKIDPLEKLTVQIITGEIDVGKYKNDIMQQLGLSMDDSNNLITDVDNGILKTIKENLKISLSRNEDKVPFPPYSKVITNEKLLINNREGEDKNGAIGGITFEPIIKDTSVVTPLAINMLKDKLESTTTSPSTTSDYSLPKISTKIDQTTTTPVSYNSNLHDPYHEEI
jgi:hypothetical protein